jgi:hypothetical protein
LSLSSVTASFSNTSEKNGWNHNRQVKEGPNQGAKALATCDNFSGANLEI